MTGTVDSRREREREIVPESSSHHHSGRTADERESENRRDERQDVSQQYMSDHGADDLDKRRRPTESSLHSVEDGARYSMEQRLQDTTTAHYDEYTSDAHYPNLEPRSIHAGEHFTNQKRSGHGHLSHDQIHPSEHSSTTEAGRRLDTHPCRGNENPRYDPNPRTGEHHSHDYIEHNSRSASRQLEYAQDPSMEYGTWHVALEQVPHGHDYSQNPAMPGRSEDWYERPSNNGPSHDRHPRDHPEKSRPAQAASSARPATRREPIPQAETTEQRLRRERNTAEAALTQAAQDLKQVKAMLSNLQEEKLSEVDRFKPIVDEEVMGPFHKLQMSARALGAQLAKSTQLQERISPSEWGIRISVRMWPQAFPHGSGKMDPKNNKVFCSTAWRLVAWFWLHQTVLCDPFCAFPGMLSRDLKRNYKALFAESFRKEKQSDCDFPVSQDSAIWKSISIASLAKLGTPEEEMSKFRENATDQLFALIGKLGCVVIDTPKAQNDLNKKARAALGDALKFARLVAGQRTVYRLFIPALQKGQMKASEDSNFTNADEEQEGCEEESSGTIHYLGRPGLERCGTPMGADLDKERVVLVKAFVHLVE